MIGFGLTEEQLAQQRATREFAEKEMKPYAAELDRRHDPAFDWGVVRRMAKAKLWSLLVPEEYGGVGMDSVTAAVVGEEMGAACMGMTVVCGGT